MARCNDFLMIEIFCRMNQASLSLSSIIDYFIVHLSKKLTFLREKFLLDKNPHFIHTYIFYINFKYYFKCFNSLNCKHPKEFVQCLLWLFKIFIRFLRPNRGNVNYFSNYTYAVSSTREKFSLLRIIFGPIATFRTLLSVL